MLNNIELFNECLQNPEKPIDPANREILNKPVISNNNPEYEEIKARNNQLKELVTEFEGASEEDKEKIVKEIDKCIDYPNMNLGPFSQYMMIHNINHDMYIDKLTMEEKIYIVNCYLEDRHHEYLERDYSDIAYQILSDNYSHKRKGNLGVKKLENICEKRGLNRISSIENICDNCYYFLPDNKHKELLQPVLDEFNINFKFKQEHQNKLPDAVIKIYDVFIIVEHKLIKQSGGGQDKQLTEIIDFIKHGERGIRYVSFLDGVYFNKLIDPSHKNKLYTIKNNILENLRDNPYNYFVNNYGFNALLDSLIN